MTAPPPSARSTRPQAAGLGIRRIVRRVMPTPVVETYRAHHRAGQAAARLSPEETQVIRDHCPAGCVALDVGANAGGYTWHLRGLAAAVHAFEPIPGLAFGLRCAFLGDRTVHVHNLALSDRPGRATLRIPLHRGAPVTGLATLAGGDRLSDLAVRQIRIRLNRLDDMNLAGHIGFIKIDVEGHELAVLHGAMRTLQVHMPALWIEIGADTMRPVAALLRDLGYSGSFSFRGRTCPVEQFDARLHQPAAALNALRQPMTSDPYVSNFLFVRADRDR